MIEITTTDNVGLITLARPEARNALTGAMMRDLANAVRAFDDNEAIGAIVLTGKDPAFCAGLDLRDLATTYQDIQLASETTTAQRVLLPAASKPIIAAVNGPAVTGGLELALGCDWMIASREHATFADTHARVGVMPGGGMTIRLPQLIGINRARQMSFTGNFIGAATAYEWGLVNEICDHEALLPRAFALAGAINESRTHVVRELRTMYETLALRSDDDVYKEEARWSRKWMHDNFDGASFNNQRENIIARGSSQQ